MEVAAGARRGGGVAGGPRAARRRADEHGRARAADDLASPAAPRPRPRRSGASAAAANLPVTLPVLDAMFADEAFAGELKSKLQLTDEQVDLAQGGGRGARQPRRGTPSSPAPPRRDPRAPLRRFSRSSGPRRPPPSTPSSASAGRAAPSAALEAELRADGHARRRQRPAYRMDVFQGGKLVKTYKVGIGYPEFPCRRGCGGRHHHLQPDLDAARRALGQGQVRARQRRSRRAQR